MTASLEPTYAWDGRRGPSLTELVRGAHVRLDAAGVRAAFGEAEPDGTTCIEGARELPASYVAGAQARRTERSLHEALDEACARLAPGRVALALSGGVDSAVLAALLGRRAVAYTLATLPGYGEESEAAVVAARFGVELRHVPAGEQALVAALPDAVGACERPLYNLHPVGRWLLARAAREDGWSTLVTGDGADQVFCGVSGADYLPVVGALGRAAGVATVAPFLDAAVVASADVDPDKRALRTLALRLGVPPDVALRPKAPRFAPPMDLDRHWDPTLLAALGRRLGREPSRATDRARVGWTTLGLFARSFPGLEL